MNIAGTGGNRFLDNGINEANGGVVDHVAVRGHGAFSAVRTKQGICLFGIEIGKRVFRGFGGGDRVDIAVDLHGRGENEIHPSRNLEGKCRASVTVQGLGCGNHGHAAFIAADRQELVLFHEIVGKFPEKSGIDIQHIHLGVGHAVIRGTCGKLGDLGNALAR